jgi:hypothetical protein
MKVAFIDGYKGMIVHFVSDVKHEPRYKAHPVTDGHLPVTTREDPKEAL